MDFFSLHAPMGWHRRLLFAIPLLLLIAACGRATSAPPQVTAPVGQTGTFKPGDTTRSMVYAGIERKYILHIPAGYDAARPTPLVLGFHGIGLNAEEMIRISKLNDQSDKSGFVVVYPNGTGATQSWNGGHCCGEAAQKNVDDVGFTRALIAANPDFRTTLKRAGFVKRDPRVKERKKYGQKSARARFQFSKR